MKPQASSFYIMGTEKKGDGKGGEKGGECNPFVLNSCVFKHFLSFERT